MAEDEKTPAQERADLKRDTEGVLLEAIKRAAADEVGAQALLALAQAFSTVMGVKVPDDKSDDESDKSRTTWHL